MRLGLQVPNFTWPGGPAEIGATLSSIAQRAENAGVYSLWTMDHFFQIGRWLGPPEAEMLEGWTALTFAAASTSSIRLGTLVTGVTYRHPGVLVKTATTLDVLSGGRSYFGIGAAWNEAESRGLGIPFPPLAERFERLEETLQIAHRMWSADESPFAGKHYTLERPLCSPPPLQRPHPPIIIGGGGERKTLRLVAQYADACNLFAYDLGSIGHKLAVLREHCDALGRNYDAIEKTSTFNVALDRSGRDGAMTPPQFVESLAAQAAAGIEHAVVSIARVEEPAVLDMVGSEVVPALTAITAAGR